MAPPSGGDERGYVRRVGFAFDPFGRDDRVGFESPAFEAGSSPLTVSVAAPAKAPTAASVTFCVASESRDEADLICFFPLEPLCPANTAAAAPAPAISAAATASRTNGELKELVTQFAA